MSQFSQSVIDQLSVVAHEAREVFEERGYAVGAAIGLDPAFRRSRRPSSALNRELISAAIEVGAVRAGLHCGSSSGGAVELHIESAPRWAVLRLKSAKKAADGTYRIVTNSSSTWGAFDEETLVYEEPWVFGYTLSSAGLDEIFVAHVDAITEGAPGVLILGEPILLGKPSPSTGGFQPADESLPGFEEFEEDTEWEGNGVY